MTFSGHDDSAINIVLGLLLLLLLYCTYMMVWPDVTASINCHEYCVYYIGNVN